MADKKTTVRDLKTFIDAVEFASDQEEWVPSARQWKRIRDMINHLEEPEDKPVAEPLRPPQLYPAFNTAPVPSAQAPVFPTHSSGLPHPQQLHPQVNTPSVFNSPKTPDVDTNGKPYQSSFAL